MKVDIENFLRETCPRFGMSATFRPDKNYYVVHKRGYAIQKFTPSQFYEIPKPVRRNMLRAIMQRGLTFNMGEKNVKHNLLVRSQLGTKIV